MKPAEAIRRALTDPHRVVRALRLERGAKSQSGGVLILCPIHNENTPSCSVTKGPDGTLRFRCFGCGETGDVLTLIAARHQFSLRREFGSVVAVGCELAGIPLPENADCSRSLVPPIDFPEPPAPEAQRDYPARQEVSQLWESGYATECIKEAQSMLASRGLEPDASLARAIGDETELPSWASYRSQERREAKLSRQSWRETGHLVMLPVYDAPGEMRSLRAWQCMPGYEGPKRLPAAGHKSSELVLANEEAVAMLREPGAPKLIIISEGEPDFLTACQAYHCVAVIGIGSFSGIKPKEMRWEGGFAQRIPMGSLVMVRTHQDEAGERYARAIVKSLRDRAVVRRVT